MDLFEEEEAQRRLERKKRLLQLQAQKEIAELDEDDSRYAETLQSDENVNDDPGNVITERTGALAHLTEQSGNAKVRSWIASGESEIVNEPLKLTEPAERKIESLAQTQIRRPENNLHRFIARQTMGKDLPKFGGLVTDWPLFISSFRQTTVECDYQPNENVMRLRNCLTGEAREAVEALLMTTKVDKIIDTLERRFGRPEFVIQALMRKATDFPKVKDDRPESVVKFADAVTNLVATIEALEKKDYLFNPILTDALVQKLSVGMRFRWGKRISKANRTATLVEFAEFLDSEAVTMSLFCNPFSDTKQSKDCKAVLSLTDEKDNKQQKCAYCEKPHVTAMCTTFKKLDNDGRWKWAVENRVCFKCLTTNHRRNKCKRKQCGKDGCMKPHHPLLHNEKREINPTNDNIASQTASGSASDNSQVEKVNIVRRERKRVLMMIVPVTLEGPNGQMRTYAFLDSGSTTTIIDSDLAKELGLEGYAEPLNSKWMNKMTYEDRSSRRVTVRVIGENNIFELENIRTMKELELPCQPFEVDSSKWDHLKNINLPDTAGAVPRILIGEDHAHVKIAQKIIVGRRNAPIATLTPLGWTVHGPFVAARVNSECILQFYQNEEEDKISHQMRDFWTTESFGVNTRIETLRSKGDTRAEEILSKTAIHENNRWEVGLLWKTDNEALPESRRMAEKRLQSLVTRLRKNPDFELEYNKKMSEYLTKHYARVLTADEEKNVNERTWYLPQFAVTNPNKPGKIRLILDAAAKSHGVSMNDRLLKGPDLYNSLVGILFTFRERAVAICGDLKEMFHQIKIRKEDQDSQRFLFRDSKTDQVITMKMKVMIFGSVSSPYVAQEIRNRNANKLKAEYPEACKAITDRHYMDDYLDSTDTIDEALERAHAVAKIHKTGGFEIRNWMSNSPEVLESLPLDSVAQRGTNLAFSDEDFTRVLGVVWSPEQDTFSFSANFPRLDNRLISGEKSPTKREVLRVVMSVFDPLGLLTVMTIRGKILMQDIWRAGIDWDTVLPDNLCIKWKIWLKDVQSASQLRIPRCYSLGIGKLREVQLHVFCDASEQAFAAAAYLRLEGEAGRKTVMVMSKSRVAPLKPLTIPRLELQATVMGTRLARTIIEQHSISIAWKIFWTDSQTVLKWIRSDARKYQPFVAHRIAEVLETTTVQDWRWVPTTDNVADDATRDTDHLSLTNTCRWMTGPEFLLLDEHQWPTEMQKQQPSKESDNELRREFTSIKKQRSTESRQEFIWSIDDKGKFPLDCFRFSKWLRLTRAMAWCLRFVNKIQNRDENTGEELTAKEIYEGEIRVLRMAQSMDFKQDLQLLEQGKALPTSSRLKELSPQLGSDGLIRMSGRIKNKEISQSVREPIILNGTNYIVKLLILYYHEQAGHQGRERVVNDLRSRYWIIKTRSAVRAVCHDCQTCKVRKAKPFVPEMAPLPDLRTQDFVKPFTNTGIDYFGPFQVTIGRRREKRYGVLFTCLSIRAVHLEIANSLSADSMIMALRRMMARRGKPKTIYSDNGTNFVGANRELREALNDLDQAWIQQQTATQGIEWHFIPPSAPHMGGCWERLVGSVKRALEAIMNEQHPKEEILQTLFAEAEFSINSRPLTYVSDDPNDPESLTPNHFLLMWRGPYESHGAPGLFTTDDLILRKQWRKAQLHADQFWRRWLREYVPTLNRRSKWHQNNPDRKVGDLVIIWDNQLPRNQWLRGIITQVIPGKDGHVRVADVKTKSGTYRRPVSKLCVLDAKKRGIPG